MFKKIKEKFNPKYAEICFYIVATAVVIFALAFATTKIKYIVTFIWDFLKGCLNVLAPVLIGALVAYIFDPLVEFFERQYKKIKWLHFKDEKKYRTLGVFTTVIAIVLVIVGTISFAVYSITNQVQKNGLDDIVNLFANYIDSFTDSLDLVQEKLEDWNIKSAALEDYIKEISASLANWLQEFAQNLVEYTKHFSGIVSNLGFGLILAIYLLLEKKSFQVYGKKLSKALFEPATEEKILGFLGDLDHIFSGYIRGQLADVAIMCCMLSITLSAIGIKFGIIIGIFAGICNLVPYFGPIVAYVGTISFGLLYGQNTKVIIAVIALIIVQQIDGSIIGPKLLGDNVSLKPVFILVSVIIGSSLFGIVGMILAVPVAAMIKLMVKKFIDNRLKAKGIVFNQKGEIVKGKNKR
ncbi:MAG: AI-2E family transporter [Lachnospiraceae bacterium]|nr:AI-2E family transporter [Lachnospiraceae bacterium]MEE1341811.1 AI-2E family transporter [Lachnospiraceae bacterium]